MVLVSCDLTCNLFHGRFKVFYCGGQAYQAKLARVGLEEVLARNTDALNKIEAISRDSTKSSDDISRELRICVAEARGEVDKLVLAENTRKLAAEADLSPENASKKKVLL